MMVHLGTGHCDATGYYAGWDSKGLESRKACEAICLSEEQCTYAAWFHGKTCSRYNGETCNLDRTRKDFEKHELFKKQHSAGRFCNIIQDFFHDCFIISNNFVSFSLSHLLISSLSIVHGNQQSISTFIK